MHTKVKARKWCCDLPFRVVKSGWASLVIFVMQPSPVFSASRYSTALMEPIPQVPWGAQQESRDLPFVAQIRDVTAHGQPRRAQNAENFPPPNVRPSQPT